MGKIRHIIKTHKGASTTTLLKRLNPVIRGWAYVYRHVVSSVRVLGEDDGVVSARANYAVFQTLLDPVNYGTTEVYSAGEYQDKIVFENGAAKYKEKIVVVDTSRISSLLATPL